MDLFNKAKRNLFGMGSSKSTSKNEKSNIKYSKLGDNDEKKKSNYSTSNSPSTSGTNSFNFKTSAKEDEGRCYTMLPKKNDSMFSRQSPAYLSQRKLLSNRKSYDYPEKLGDPYAKNQTPTTTKKELEVAKYMKELKEMKESLEKKRMEIKKRENKYD